jgi:hypothetical protein
MSLTKVTQSMISGAAAFVNDFGAVGDGVTDDTAAIQAAINSGSNQVVFENGKTYAITAQLILQSNQDIVGNGATVLVTSASTIDSAFYGEDIQTSNYVNLRLNCNSKTISGFRLYADVSGCNGVMWDSCRIERTAVDATLFYGGIEVASLGGAVGTQNSDIKVVNCNFGPTGTHGCLIAYTDGVLFAGNRIATATNHGMEAVGCRDVIITDNTVLNCVLSALGVGSQTRNFTIANNTIKNCGGDGSITCEYTSVFGTITNNAIYDANTAGINISYGNNATNNPPYDKVQGIVCEGNMIRAKANTGNAGINFYSTTGAGLGTGVIVSNNVIDGFNVGITYAYAKDGQIANNMILNLYGGGSAAVKATLVYSVDIINNSCGSNTSDHAYQVLTYAGAHSEFCNISGNYAAGAGSATKALIYIEGPNAFQASGNSTAGALNYVLTASTATVVVSDNFGNLASSPYAGTGKYDSQLGTATATTVGVAGPASALPATPKGYVTVEILGVGPSKIPYYAL